MATVRRSYRTNRLLWAMISIALFVPLGFWNWRGIHHKVFVCFWEYVVAIRRDGFDVIVDPEFLFSFTFEFLVIAIPSVVFGWLVHAVIIVVVTRWRERSTNRTTYN